MDSRSLYHFHYLYSNSFCSRTKRSARIKLAGFFTHATSSEGFNRWASKCASSFQKTSKEKKIDFEGYYNCQGALSPPIQEFIKREIVTSADEWEEYIKEVMKHPTPEDLQKAREFARDILSQA